MLRSSGLQRQIRTGGLTRHLSQEGEDYQDAKRHVRQAQRKIEGCADGWNKDADNRKCTQENSGTYETMISWDILASDDRTPRHTHIFLSLVRVPHLIAPLTFTRTRVWLKTCSGRVAHLRAVKSPVLFASGSARHCCWHRSFQLSTSGFQCELEFFVFWFNEEYSSQF